MLISTDEFCDVSASNLTVELRRELLARLGMYGVRVSLQELANGATTAAALGPRLVARSGLDELRRLIAEHFMPRVAGAQGAHRGAGAAGARGRRCVPTNPEAAVKLDREVEQVEAGAVEFARMRGAHLVSTGEAKVAERERAELERLLLAATPAAAVGLGDRTPAPRRSSARRSRASPSGVTGPPTHSPTRRSSRSSRPRPAAASRFTPPPESRSTEPGISGSFA